MSGQLKVTRGDTGRSTTVGVTLHVAGSQPVVQVNPPASNCVGLGCRVIQPAIDAAPSGALIVINPGGSQEHVDLLEAGHPQGDAARR